MAFGVKMSVKNLFFDRATVVREVGKANAKALSKAGAFVRRRARSLLRRRKKTSEPGQPPSVHSGEPNLRTIYFAYDRNNQSVVIGPLRFNGGGGSVPALHEFGGTKAVRRTMGRGQNKQAVFRAAKYPARPFMGPALAAEVPNFPSLWAYSVKGAA